MKAHVLITGGAGFLGSHLADELLRAGYAVRVLDNLSPQVHGADARRPGYLSRDVELRIGDVRRPEDVQRALVGIDRVVHFAAMVGVGQSMYEIASYTSVNSMGTAVLLEAMTQKRDPGQTQIQKLLVASSMSVYGEGFYRGDDGQPRPGRERSPEQLRSADWEVRDDAGKPLTPCPTPETKLPALPSIYALSKYEQEKACLLIGRAYGIPTVALRFFNAYGPRQALSNPYTGVLAIFASRLLNGRPPLLFEDGQQRRDFVSVYDVARACRLALESDAADNEALNIGSGRERTVEEVARAMAIAVGKPHIEPTVTGKYRVGDIRHCFPDISRARRVLGFEPRVDFAEGLSELAEWLRGQAPADHAAKMVAELSARGLSL